MRRSPRPTAAISCALATGGNPPGQWNVSFGRSHIKLGFLDSEVPPAKTTSKAPCFLNEFDGGGSSLLIKTDAFLLGGDGTPVVAEAKVTMPKSYDTNTFLALVQALANACLLATADQRERLRRCYGLASTPVAVDVAITTYRSCPFKVNLIPFNPTDRYDGSSRAAIERFRAVLLGAGVPATVRLTRGRDIEAVCGQLAAAPRDRVAAAT